MDDRDDKGRFVPGNNANPGGRPRKGNALTEILRTVGADAEDGKTKNEKLAAILWAKALDGDMAAIKYIYDRIDGQPIATQEITGKDGAPVGFRFVSPNVATSEEV